MGAEALAASAGIAAAAGECEALSFSTACEALSFSTAFRCPFTAFRRLPLSGGVRRKRTGTQCPIYLHAISLVAQCSDGDAQPGQKRTEQGAVEAVERAGATEEIMKQKQRKTGREGPGGQNEQ